MSWYSGFMALVGHMTGVVLEQLLSAYRRERAGVSLLEREREGVSLLVSLTSGLVDEIDIFVARSTGICKNNRKNSDVHDSSYV